MRKLFCVMIVAAMAAGASSLGANPLAGKSIKDVMNEGHKGKQALCGLASQGKASKDDVKKLVDLYTDMCKCTPPKGDEAAWKKKAEALLEATKKLEADPTDKGAAKAYGAAVNCKGCHSEFKK